MSFESDLFDIKFWIVKCWQQMHCIMQMEFPFFGKKMNDSDVCGVCVFFRVSINFNHIFITCATVYLECCPFPSKSYEWTFLMAHNNDCKQLSSKTHLHSLYHIWVKIRITPKIETNTFFQIFSVNWIACQSRANMIIMWWNMITVRAH